MRSWYIWRDPNPDGSPPNNWLNRYGRSGWTFHEPTGQFYFATFTPEQPELNWRCDQLREAMFDVLRFWLDRGTDGVRIDALAHVIKDSQFRDNPINLGYSDDQEPSNVLKQFYSQNQPEIHDLIKDLRTVVDEYPDRLLMGEAYQVAEQIASYQRAGAHVLLNTSMLQGDFEAAGLRNSIDQVEALTPKNGWPSHSAGNHDIPRLSSRVGESNLRLAALLQFTVRGAATMYYGDELGLQPLDLPSELMRDPSGRDNPRYSRDHSRAPMPWDDGVNNGFTGGDPWLPSDELTRRLNVEGQLKDHHSLLHFYRKVLRLRNDYPELQSGDYWPIDIKAPVLAFYRGTDQRKLLVAMNIGDSEASLHVHNLHAKRILSTSFSDQEHDIGNHIVLHPREGILALVDG
jgi:alpha-glucosidase